ncbi:MAG: VanW family protein [Coriobacteriia bacterium]|nr:VanW family protein [Coriobacteriia bacterium]
MTTRTSRRGGRTGTSRRGSSASTGGGLRWPAWLERWPAPARTALVLIAALAVVLVVGAGVDLAVAAGRIHPGVQVGEVAVGGMTEPEAAVAISTHVAQKSVEPVTVAADDATWQVTAEQVGLSVDATSLAGDAFAVGRGSFGPAAVERIRAVVAGLTVPLELGYDEAGLGSLVQTVQDVVGMPAVDASVLVEGDEVSLVESAEGLGIDERTAAERIVAAFLADERTVTLDLVALAPEITEDGAQGAYEAARTMVSAPVTLYYEDRRWEVPATVIGDWIGFRRAETSETPTLEAYIISEEVSATVLPMVTEVGKPAKDATFKASAGVVTIIPAEDGLAADAESLATRLETVLTGPGERTAELTMHRVPAARTTEDAEKMGIKERISTFTTEFSSANKARVNNIHVLSDALNGTLIPPGGVFGFNETIGERTAAKGYQEANAIVNGELVPQLGGGICQVGTTIFNTVFFSGLPVVERRNHSQYISSYPKGRDATVSWGGPDFKFKNDTEYWVLVATSYTNSSVTISLYGTSPGYDVTYNTGDWTNLIDPPVREIPDPDMPVGSKVVEERGVSGRTIVVTRTVSKGGTVVRTDTFKSVYRPVEEVVRVGTKPIASDPTTPTP